MSETTSKNAPVNRTPRKRIKKGWCRKREDGSTDAATVYETEEGATVEGHEVISVNYATLDGDEYVVRPDPSKVISSRDVEKAVKAQAQARLDELTKQLSESDRRVLGLI